MGYTTYKLPINPTCINYLTKLTMNEDMGVETKIGVVNPPKWMVKIMEKPYEQMDDLGGNTPIFGLTPR